MVTIIVQSHRSIVLDISYDLFRPHSRPSDDEYQQSHEGPVSHGRAAETTLVKTLGDNERPNGRTLNW